MTIEQIIDEFGAIVFLDQETDLLIAWDGRVHFEIFAGKFDGNYDKIDAFYREVKTIHTAKTVAKMWFDEHAIFNPGP